MIKIIKATVSEIKNALHLEWDFLFLTVTTSISPYDWTLLKWHEHADDCNVHLCNSTFDDVSHHISNWAFYFGAFVPLRINYRGRPTPLFISPNRTSVCHLGGVCVSSTQKCKKCCTAIQRRLILLLHFTNDKKAAEKRLFMQHFQNTLLSDF